MDNIDLRKKPGAFNAFPLGTALVSAAFALGAVSLTLLLRSNSSSVMSISTCAVTDLWLCFALLILAQALCIIMPCARVLTAVFAVLTGADAELISYSYSEFALFSPEFFALFGVIFAFSAAGVYACDRAFTLSPKLRAFIRADRRLRYELNLFCAVFAALMLAAIVSAVLFIL
jgi:hypothetical protein